MLARGMNAQEVADELTRRSGRTIKPCLVNAWIAKLRQSWRLPAELVPAVCEILNDDSIQRLLLSDKLRQALEFGESGRLVISQLRRVLKEPRRRSKR